MKISNFTKSELEQYYIKNETVFFNYRKCFILSKEDNLFKFTELKKARSISPELPHTKRGRFHTFKLNSSYCKSLNI